MPGLDTLEEGEDKKRFFSNLEGSRGSSLDYSELNRQLGETGQSSLALRYWALCFVVCCSVCITVVLSFFPGDRKSHTPRKTSVSSVTLPLFPVEEESTSLFPLRPEDNACSLSDHCELVDFFSCRKNSCTK